MSKVYTVYLNGIEDSVDIQYVDFCRVEDNHIIFYRNPNVVIASFNRNQIKGYKDKYPDDATKISEPIKWTEILPDGYDLTSQYDVVNASPTVYSTESGIFPEYLTVVNKATNNDVKYKLVQGEE